MSETLIIFLIIGGLLFIMLEILVMPGTAIVGVMGGAMIIFAIINAYSVSTSFGHSTLIGSFLISVLLIFISIKAKTWKRISLGKEIEGRMNVREENVVKEGDTGITLSRLNPIGNALINDQVYEVESTEGFLPENSEITIIKILPNKIKVRGKDLTAN